MASSLLPSGKNFYVARCTRPTCRNVVGGFHVLCTGTIMFVCYKCEPRGFRSIYTIELDGIQPQEVGAMPEGKSS